MPPGKHLNPQRWNDPKKTGQCAHIILSVWGRLQAPVRASQTRRHKRVLSLRVYKAEEMCCLVEKHSLFSHSEIFPNRRLFDSSPHLKPSVNLPTGSFNKSFFFFLIGCSFAPDRWEAFMRRGHTTINYKLSLNPLLCHKQGFIVDMAMQTWALLHGPDLYHCGNRQPEEDGFASNQGPARDG